ncbi:MAG: hypothetical protein Q8R81_09595 [Novosphingobium sp.]|nr:hypothetical protein [Novosphingobium sp.]MDP3550638.1 hypothetical protein [Novosphingobium sp.]
MTPTSIIGHSTTALIVVGATMLLIGLNIGFLLGAMWRAFFPATTGVDQ